MEIRDFVRRCSMSYPDKVAYIDGERRCTWRLVRERSVRLAAALQRTLGVREGDVVAMLSHDHVEAVEHVFACMEIGAVRVGVNRGYSRDEIAHVIRDSDARVLIVQANCRPFVEPFLDAFEREGRRLVGFGDGHGFALDYETLLAVATEPEPVELHDNDPAAISYTSGTTGYPKGAIYKASGMRDMLVHFVLSTGLRHEDRWMNPTSMAWATFMLNVMSVVNGMTTVLPGEDFRPETLLDVCTRERVTGILAVPVMLQRLIAAYGQDAQRYDLAALRLVIYGSAPASPTLIESAIETFGIELIQSYGLTEFCAWVTFLQHGDHVKALAGKPDILTSCGKPGLHCEVSIRDEHGVPVLRGQTGELWVKSETLMLGYRNLPELSAEVLHGDWLRTHDIGHEDDDGYIHLTDRRHFLIVTGAANVFPSIVENTLAAHPQVREVAVVGAPHPEWGEAVVAMVALKADAAVTPDELIRHCHGRIAKWEVPKFIEIVPELPKGPTLKILKKRIKERYASEPGVLPWSAKR